MLIFTEAFGGALHTFISFNSLNNTLKSVLSLFSFYRGRKRGSERLGNLPTVTQLVIVGAGTWTLAFSAFVSVIITVASSSMPACGCRCL